MSNFNLFIKHVLFVLALLALVVLLGCQEEQLQKSKVYAVNTAAVANSLTELDKAFDKTSQVVNGLFDRLTQQDIVALSQSVNALQQLRNSIHKTIQASGGLTQFLINAQQLQQFALKGGESYARARAIITKYWDVLPASEQTQLLLFDNQVTHLQQAVMQLQKVPDGTDITQTVQDIISIGAATARVLVMTGVI